MKILNLSATLVVFLSRFARIVAIWVIGILLYQFVLDELIKDDRILLGTLLFWLLTAYFTLPRLHRFLTRLYLPDYFIGRVRTGDGLLGDPVNIGLLGAKKELVAAMHKAGWHQADDLDNRSSLKMVKTSITGQSYQNAPVSSLFLFGKKQDLAFQQEVDGNPRKRHHVRFWRCPQGWVMPGGVRVDWLGAATYDKSVGLSLFTLQITHKIAENTDEERDYVLHTLKKHAKASVHIIKDYSAGYHHRNGGGDRIKTDGALPVVNLRHK